MIPTRGEAFYPVLQEKTEKGQYGLAINPRLVYTIY